MIELERVMQKGLAVAMSAMIAVSAFPTAVYAEGNKVEVYANDESISETVGDVSVENDLHAVSVSGANGNTATVKTGDISYKTNVMGDALQVSTGNGGKADVTTGSITAVNTGEYNSYCATVNSHSNGSESKVVINGDLNSKLNAVDITAMDGGSNDVTVNGNVSGTIFVSSEGKDSTNDANINGDVNGKLNVSGSGKDTVTIKGNIKSDESYALVSNSGDGSNVIKVSGDVSGKNTGICIMRVARSEGEYPTGSDEIVVEGTISGGRDAINAYGSERMTITAWKVEPNKDGVVATDIHGNENKEVEKKIQYIIKIEQPKTGATLSATDANGGALKTVEGATDTWQWANEGDKVLLKVDLAKGFRITGAYGDSGKSYALKKDSSGNYYIEVPRGGGVYLSVTLAEGEDSGSSSSDTAAPAQTEVGTPVTTQVTLSETAAVNLINDTPYGGTVILQGLTGTSISPMVVATLLARRDITVNLTYYVNGIPFMIVIPAGFDLSALLNAEGGIDFETLAKKLGAVQMN